MKKVRWILFTLVALVLVAQVFRPERTNPASDPLHAFAADTTVPASVRAALERSCSDCHSNMTRWPWYSAVTPVNYFIARDVRDGRRHLNLSEWMRMSPVRRGHAYENIADEVSHGEMPPANYLIMHVWAKLTDDEVRAVTEWAKAGPRSAERTP